MNSDLKLLVECLPVSPYRDILEKTLKELSTYPKYHGNWIVQYDEEVFVVFDPFDGGSSILCATRSLEDAENNLKNLEW